MTSEGVEMEVPTVQKQQFRNMSGGWLGVVKLNHKGEERGTSVEPNGTVWLSETEQMLTANAPRRPEDNPFTPNTFKRVNPETSEIEEFEVTPLVPISENRYVPAGDRPVPGVGVETFRDGRVETIAGSAMDEKNPERAEERAASEEAAKELEAERTAAKQEALERARADKTAAQAADSAQEAPSAPQTTEEPAQPAAAPEPGAEVAQAAPSAPEETGAAQQPSGDAPSGEFAAHEEVGTPDAPTQVEEQPVAPPQAPAPWSPGSESPEDAQAAGRVPPPDPSGE